MAPGIAAAALVRPGPGSPERLLGGRRARRVRRPRLAAGPGGRRRPLPGADGGHEGDGLAGVLRAQLPAAGRPARGEIAASRPALTAGVMEFLQETVERYRGHPALTAWQVENEPLNISGPHRWWIAPQILRQELAAVRAADPSRRVVVTAFAHFNRLLDTLSTPRGQSAGRLLELLSPGDVLGLDVYQRIGRRQFGFKPGASSGKKSREAASDHGRGGGWVGTA